MAKTNAEVNKEIDEFIVEVEPELEVEPEFEVEPIVEPEPIVDIKRQYEDLLNFLKPLLSHEALVTLAAKKKEIFG